MKWINVKNKLPENNKKVLTWQIYDVASLDAIRIMRYKYNMWEGPGFGHVTHWMPLPEPPK
jgi:hypothetical protein